MSSYSPKEGAENVFNYPTNSVIGVVDNREDARSAIRQLKAAGFPEDKIGLLFGARDTEQVEGGTEEEEGFWGKITRMIQEFGDVDQDHKEYHKQQLLAGHYLVTVHAEDDAARDRACDILKENNAHFINYYGEWAVDNLAP
jgi:hypothetical protein